MNNNFFSSRVARFLITSVLILTLTYVLTVLITKEKHDDPTIPEFTAECIQKRPQVVNKDITDFNCSLENNTRRMFFSVSDDYIKELNQKYPIKFATFDCNPFGIKSFARNNDKIDNEKVSEMLLSKDLRLDQYCKKEPRYKSDYLEISYVDKNNSPITILTFSMD